MTKPVRKTRVSLRKVLGRLGSSSSLPEKDTDSITSRTSTSISPKRVRFAEEFNRYHHADRQRDMSSTWYTRDEIVALDRSTTQRVSRFLQQDPAAAELYYLYKSLQQQPSSPPRSKKTHHTHARTDDGDSVLVQSLPAIHSDDDTVGLEVFVLPSRLDPAYQKDFLERVHALQQTQYLFHSGQRRATALRDASFEYSRASRLYALYTAQRQQQAAAAAAVRQDTMYS